MAIYDFKCDHCGNMMRDVMLPITHDRTEIPMCCDDTMGYYISSPPMVHWIDPVIEPFRAIATKDRPVITNTRQHREYMAKHDLIDANDLIGKPPSHLDQEKEVAEMQKSIEAITPTKQQASMMKDRGIAVDIIE